MRKTFLLGFWILLIPLAYAGQEEAIMGNGVLGVEANTLMYSNNLTADVGFSTTIDPVVSQSGSGGGPNSDRSTCDEGFIKMMTNGSVKCVKCDDGFVNDSFGNCILENPAQIANEKLEDVGNKIDPLVAKIPGGYLTILVVFTSLTLILYNNNEKKKKKKQKEKEEVQ